MPIFCPVCAAADSGLRLRSLRNKAIASGSWFASLQHAGRSQAFHLLYPGNLSLAIQHPDKEVKVLGTVQSLGMLAAVGFFVAGAVSVASAFVQMGEQFDKDSKLNKYLKRWKELASGRMQLLQPEFASGSSIDIFCVDGQKP